MRQPLRKKCPNTEFLLVRIFLYSEKTPYSDTIHAESHGREKKDIACSKLSHNKSMGGVDLTDRFIALYRIQYKTMCW